MQIEEKERLLAEQKFKIEEQMQAIAEADSARRLAIIALVKAGTPVDVIAASFGVEPDFVERIRNGE